MNTTLFLGEGGVGSGCYDRSLTFSPSCSLVRQHQRRGERSVGSVVGPGWCPVPLWRRRRVRLSRYCVSDEQIHDRMQTLRSRDRPSHSGYIRVSPAPSGEVSRCLFQLYSLYCTLLSSTVIRLLSPACVDWLKVIELCVAIYFSHFSAVRSLWLSVKKLNEHLAHGTNSLHNGFSTIEVQGLSSGQ